MKFKEKLFVSFVSFFFAFIFLSSITVSVFFTKNEQQSLKNKFISFTVNTVYNVNYKRKLYLEDFPIKFHSFISSLIKDEKNLRNIEIVNVSAEIIYSYRDFFKKEKKMMVEIPLNSIRNVTTQVIEKEGFLIVIVPIFEEDGSHTLSFIYYFDFSVFKSVFTKTFFIIFLINIPLFFIVLTFVNRRVKRMSKSLENLLLFIENKGEKEILRNIENSGTYEIKRLSSSLYDMMEEVEKSFKREQEIRKFLESVLDSSPSGIFIVDKKLLIRFKNRVFIEKYEKNKKLLWFIFELLPDRIKEKNEIKLDGRTYSVLSYDVEGGFKVILIDDITSEIELKQKLIIAQKMESLGLFIASIVHDIKNMVGVVSGYLEILEENKTPETEPYINNMKTALKETQTLIRNFLKFSYSKTEERKIHLIDEIILETLELIASKLVKISLKEDIRVKSAYCKCNKENVVQVLVNIFLNAIEATKDKKDREILYRVEEILFKEDSPVIKKGKYLKITIGDNGPGIPEKIKERIFEPFFTTKDGGTGLGLFSSYLLIQKEGGFLEVKSEEGKGSEFIIYIPKIE